MKGYTCTPPTAAANLSTNASTEPRHTQHAYDTSIITCLWPPPFSAT